MATNIYCVTDWFSYFLVEADSPLEAIAKKYSRHYRYIDNKLVSEDTVVSVMCCEYEGYAETCLEKLAFDADRVLWMDSYPGTLRFQLSNIDT